MHEDATRAGARLHRGELYAASAAVAFGTTHVATSFALRGLGPLPAAAWRSALAALVLVLLVSWWRNRAPAENGAGAVRAIGPTASGSRALRMLVLAVLSGPLFLASMNLAVAHVGATITAFVAGMYAVLSAVIAPALLPERLAPRVLAGFVLALAGTALLAELDPGTSDLAGIGWGLLAAVSFGLFLVLARRWSVPYRLDGLEISLSSMTASAAVLGGIVVLIDPALLLPAGVPGEAVAAIGWLAAAAATGQVLTIAGVRLIPAARSAAFLLLNPITATILAAILLDERPSALQAAGGLLVLLGIAAATVPFEAGRAALRLARAALPRRR